MKVGIMQPYFLPYIGYFQLIASVDLFIMYDNIKYTKKGWINRNRFLRNGRDIVFTLPLKDDSDLLDVRERELAATFNREKLLNQFKGEYSHAPYFSQTFPVIESLMHHGDINLFSFLHHSILNICQHLNINTEIRISSEIAIDHSLKNQDKVLALCEATGARMYINPFGGMELYSREAFIAQGIELKFIKTKSFKYTQFVNEFIPWLSIIDVMMFNPINVISKFIQSDYELI